MNFLGIFKGITEITVSIGVGSIVGNAIRQTASPTAGRATKIAIGVGGFFLSSMVSDMVGQYTVGQIDSIYEKAQRVFKPAVAEDVENLAEKLDEAVDDAKDVIVTHLDPADYAEDPTDTTSKE